MTRCSCSLETETSRDAGVVEPHHLLVNAAALLCWPLLPSAGRCPQIVTAGDAESSVDCVAGEEAMASKTLLSLHAFIFTNIRTCCGQCRTLLRPCLYYRWLILGSRQRPP